MLQQLKQSLIRSKKMKNYTLVAILLNNIKLTKYTKKHRMLPINKENQENELIDNKSVKNVQMFEKYYI